MYIPENYSLSNPEEMHEFIRTNNFAILVNQTHGQLWATHIPLVLDTKEDGTPYLLGHLSKLNPQHEGFLENDAVLVIFSGPHAYISSSWYDHENVPTWNYIAVHVYGKIKIHSYEEALAGLKKLVDRQEVVSEHPIRMENLSERTLQEARGIVGFEIAITDMQGQKKLSQNRDDKNYQRILNALEKTDDPNTLALMQAMRKNRS
ncbi:FMN-binding negative transcriptional regulator [Flavobacterium sp.]|uniref:FMN-binding negative transcriptional regulator n=1 Tax=Flavobacterium sp. TaxID=239 RepID=UPI00263988D0|nr:FMN-binding negative transcriptional regulator [Flavobacterium sp.]